MSSPLSFSEASELLDAERELLEALHALYERAPMPQEVLPLFEQVALEYERFALKLRPILASALSPESLRADRARAAARYLARARKHLSLVS